MRKAKKVARVKPDQWAAVNATRAQAYSDMESHVCDLSMAAELAMETFDNERLFLFEVSQLDALVQQFRKNYYAEQFPPE